MPETDRIGQQFGNYRLLRRLGQGGFTQVYLGEHLYLERLAAIKVPLVSMNSNTYKSFRDQARILARLHHPHVVGIHEFGIEGEIPYFVMEYVPNGTLRGWHPRGTRLSLEQIVTYVKQVASALDYVHQESVIHRDVNPNNLLLSAKDEVVLGGFDIAFVHEDIDPLEVLDPAGTPLYMAPEQIEGRPCAASDQYALGVIVYEWLCGEAPFSGPGMAVFAQHLHEPLPSLCTHLPELPPIVEEVVFRSLAKDPQQRFPYVQDFAEALEDACLTTQPRLPRVPSESLLRAQVSAPLISKSISPDTLAVRSQDPPLSSTNIKEEAMQHIEPIKLFYCYAPQDKKLRDQLETRLMVLKRLRKITLQLNREIIAGTDWKHVQDERFHMADLILLLISPDFIASTYHYGIEMHNALEKHKAGNVRVIPILLRPTPLWQETPLGTLQMLPKSGKAITEHTHRDIVLADVVKTIGEEISLLLTR